MGNISPPTANSPELDSTKLGGRTNPSVASHKSRPSNGKVRLVRVFIDNLAGNELESLENSNGARENDSFSLVLVLSPGQIVSFSLVLNQSPGQINSFAIVFHDQL